MKKNIFIIVLIIVLLFIAGLVYVSMNNDPDNTTQPGLTTTPAATSSQVTGTVEQTTVNLYFVALEDAGEQGEEIGCNDSIVAVERTIPQTENVVETTLELLLSENQQEVGDDQLYNALSQSNLFVEEIAVSATGNATVSLEGELVSGGVCDDPRIQAQIRETVLQFPEIDQVEIMINGRNIEETISGR